MSDFPPSKKSEGLVWAKQCRRKKMVVEKKLWKKMVAEKKLWKKMVVEKKLWKKMVAKKKVAENKVNQQKGQHFLHFSGSGRRKVKGAKYGNSGRITK